MNQIPPSLPKPNAWQQEKELALQGLINDKIAQSDGFLPFDAFMRALLYTPHLGYYSGQSTVFGAQGDFVTAPQMSPLFAACVASQCRHWLEALAPDQRCVTEFGAGDGTLAAQLLNHLGQDILSYCIVELSGDLQLRQREAIKRLAPEHLPKVQWLSQLPMKITGIVLGNELLDAMPVSLFELDSQGEHVQVLERGVSLNNQQLVWAHRLASHEFESKVLNTLANSLQDNANVASAYPHGYRSELAIEASAWVSTIASRISRGVLLLIDYGFAASEFYLPQRASGTLMCHYRHHTHENPLVLLGLQDVTAHVDFSAVAQAGIQQCLTLLGYTTQARFLMHNQIGELASERIAQCQSVQERIAVTQGFQQLMSEAHMGELFKVIALARSSEPSQFAGIDSNERSNRL